MTNSLQIKTQRDADTAAVTLQEFFSIRRDLSHRLEPAFLQNTYQLLLELLPALNAQTDHFIRQKLSIQDGTSVQQGIRSSMQKVVQPASMYAVLEHALRCVAVLIRDGKGVTSAQLQRVQIVLEPMWKFMNLFVANKQRG